MQYISTVHKKYILKMMQKYFLPLTKYLNKKSKLNKKS